MLVLKSEGFFFEHLIHLANGGISKVIKINSIYETLRHNTLLRPRRHQSDAQ